MRRASRAVCFVYFVREISFKIYISTKDVANTFVVLSPHPSCLAAIHLLRWRRLILGLYERWSAHRPFKYLSLKVLLVLFFQEKNRKNKHKLTKTLTKQEQYAKIILGGSLIVRKEVQYEKRCYLAGY